MNLENAIKNMHKLSQVTGVEISKLVLAASAAELLHGIGTECGDLDVTVSSEVWNELTKKYIVEDKGGFELIAFPELEADIHVNHDGQWLHIDIVCGLAALRKDLLIPFRQSIGRPKDLERIELIRATLGL